MSQDNAAPDEAVSTKPMHPPGNGEVTENVMCGVKPTEVRILYLPPEG